MIRASVTSAPRRVSATLPRDITITTSHSPSNSAASDELTMTGVPVCDTSRRMR